jgi:hypothetical protein
MYELHLDLGHSYAMPSTQKNDYLVCQYLMYKFEICQLLLFIGPMIIRFCACINDDLHKINNLSANTLFFMSLDYINIMFLHALNRTIFIIFCNFNCHLQYVANWHMEYMRLYTSFFGWYDGYQ